VNGEPNTAVLRVGVLVESLIVPQWVAWTVARIDAVDAFELTAVIPGACGPAAAATAPRRARQLIYELYARLDRRIFGPAPAMRDTDLSPIASGRTTLTGTAPLDVVVSFLPADRTVWDGPAPRHGVWAIAPMDDGRPGSAPSRFWEVREGTGTAKTAVVARRDHLTSVIAEASAPAHAISITRTRDAAAWAAGRLVLRCLRSLQREAGSLPAAATPAEPRDPPSPVVTIRHAAWTALRGVALKIRRAWLRDEWFVAIRARTDDPRVPTPVRALPNPAGRFLADPSPIELDGQHFLFVEDYSLDARRGAISVSEAGPDEEWSPPRKVLECDHHLSYPFVFEHNGAIYMLPETGQAGRIELHRAIEFPYQWRLERVLLDGLTAVDPTLHIEDGLLWLFANIMESHEDPGELWLFSSRSLDGEWRPHPRNPIVTDPGTARPAGRLFRREGALIRPGQDCARQYGEAVVLNRVDVLSPSAYHETPVDRIEPDWLTGLKGTHTYAFDSRFEYLDGFRHVRRLRIRAPRNGPIWGSAATDR
jgi:hypothetical protein